MPTPPDLHDIPIARPVAEASIPQARPLIATVAGANTRRLAADALMDGVPSRGRSLAEVVFVIAVLFGEKAAFALAAGWSGPWAIAIPAALPIVLLAVGLWLVWGDRNGRRRRVAAMTVGVLTPVVVAFVLFAVAASGLSDDLSTDERVAQAASMAVETSAVEMSVIAGLSLVLVVFSLLDRHRQSLAAVGLRRLEPRDAGLSVLVLFGAFGVQVLSAAVIVGVMMATDQSAMEGQARERIGALRPIVQEVPLLKLVLLMPLVGLWEELVFRGFLLPRLRRAGGSWLVALLLMAVCFGIGHAYQGWLTIFQTGLLGIYFGITLIVLGRLWPAVIAHALFNTVMILVLLLALSSGEIPF